MSVWSAFITGTKRIWLHRRMVLWLYLLNALVASVILYPFFRLVSRISKTDLADDFVSGFALDTFQDFWSLHGDEFRSLGFVALGLGALYYILTVFVTGGIVATLAAQQHVSFRRFVRESGRCFVGFLRMTVLLGVVIAGVVMVYNAALGPYVDEQREAATTDRADTLWMLVGMGVAAIAFSLVLMVFQYARIRFVVERRRSVVRASFAALWFSIRRCVRVVPLFYLNGVMTLVLAIVYVGIAGSFSNADLKSSLMLFGVQQLWILSRVWMRLSFYATGVALFESIDSKRDEIDSKEDTQVTPPPDEVGSGWKAATA